MWVGAGLWHDMDFYTAFEAEYGAVFVWSMYLAFGPDGYIRYGLDDPLKALASRTVSMNEQLHNPPWANEWIVDQAKRHRIDAALVLTPLGTRPSATGNRFIELALERAGIPVLPVFADMVDARSWDAAGMRRKVATVSGTACRMSTPKQHWIISVAAVILAMMAIQMSSLGFSPLLPAIRKELAASYSQMGLFTGMYGLIAIFISLPAGILAARFGEKRMLLSRPGCDRAGPCQSWPRTHLWIRAREPRRMARRLPVRVHLCVHRHGDRHSGEVSQPNNGHPRCAWPRSPQ